jgi:hypothetical protein
MAVEPEADEVHAPAVDVMTVEVVEEIEGPVIAGMRWLRGPWAVGITAGVGVLGAEVRDGRGGRPA